jgi:hypothetical protein
MMHSFLPIKNVTTQPVYQGTEGTKGTQFLQFLLESLGSYSRIQIETACTDAA